jgi:hypothetical protein
VKLKAAEEAEAARRRRQSAAGPAALSRRCESGFATASWPRRQAAGGNGSSFSEQVTAASADFTAPPQSQRTGDAIGCCGKSKIGKLFMGGNAHG